MLTNAKDLNSQPRYLQFSLLVNQLDGEQSSEDCLAAREKLNQNVECRLSQSILDYYLETRILSILTALRSTAGETSNWWSLWQIEHMASPTISTQQLPVRALDRAPLTQAVQILRHCLCPLPQLPTKHSSDQSLKLVVYNPHIFKIYWLSFLLKVKINIIFF